MGKQGSQATTAPGVRRRAHRERSGGVGPVNRTRRTRNGQMPSCLSRMLQQLSRENAGRRQGTGPAATSPNQGDEERRRKTTARAPTPEPKPPPTRTARQEPPGHDGGSGNANEQKRKTEPGGKSSMNPKNQTQNRTATGATALYRRDRDGTEERRSRKKATGPGESRAAGRAALAVRGAKETGRTERATGDTDGSQREIRPRTSVYRNFDRTSTTPERAKERAGRRRVGRTRDAEKTETRRGDTFPQERRQDGR